MSVLVLLTIIHLSTSPSSTFSIWQCHSPAPSKRTLCHGRRTATRRVSSRSAAAERPGRAGTARAEAAGGGAGSGEPPEELPSSATARSTRLARAKVRGSHPLRGAAAVRAAGTCRPFPSAAGPAGALLPLLVPRPGLPPAPGAPQLFEPSHPELLSRSCSSKLGSPAVPTAGRGQLPAARQPLGGAGASQLRGAPLLGTARDPVKPQGESCHVSRNMPCTAEGAGP